jgi:hypothetical protein
MLRLYFSYLYFILYNSIYRTAPDAEDEESDDGLTIESPPKLCDGTVHNFSLTLLITFPT